LRPLPGPAGVRRRVGRDRRRGRRGPHRRRRRRHSEADDRRQLATRSDRRRRRLGRAGGEARRRLLGSNGRADGGPGTADRRGPRERAHAGRVRKRRPPAPDQGGRRHRRRGRGRRAVRQRERAARAAHERVPPGELDADDREVGARQDQRLWARFRQQREVGLLGPVRLGRLMVALTQRRLLARGEALLAALLLALAALAWVVTADRMGGMDAGPGTDPGTVGFFIVVWVVMMAAMMFPSVLPMVVVYGRVSRHPGRTAIFVSGYVLTWAAAGLLAYGLFGAGRALFGD